MNEAKWDKLSSQEQWKIIFKHKDSVEFMLDNDDTMIEGLGADEEVFSLRDDLGNSSGVGELLEHLGFKVEHC